jgi:hypothetical protein
MENSVIRPNAARKLRAVRPIFWTKPCICLKPSLTTEEKTAFVMPIFAFFGYRKLAHFPKIDAKWGTERRYRNDRGKGAEGFCLNCN